MIESYWRTLLDSLPIIVWAKDAQGRFLFGNEKFVRELGVGSVHDLEGSVDFDYFSEAMAQGFVEDDSEVLDAGVSKSVVEQIQRADGIVYWAYTHKSPVVINDGVVGTVGFALDVSEERRLSIEKSSGEYKYRFMVEHLPVAAMVYGLDLRRIYVNQWYEKLVGFSAELFLGKTPSESWSANIVNLTAMQYEAFLREAIDTGEVVSFDLVFVSIGRDERIVNTRMIPQKNSAAEVVSVLALVEDVTDLQGYVTLVERMAYYDHLTGIANRKKLAEEMTKVALDEQKNHQRFALMVIDLDEFKAINDVMGHAVGDQLLMEVAKRIAGVQCGKYFAARLGGDEFAVLIRQFSSQSELEVLAKELITMITQPYVINENEYFISASVGIAIYLEHTDETDNLIKCADLAMHYTKGFGRNRYGFYSEVLARQAQKKLKIEVALRKAVDKNELRLEYQPIIDLASNRVFGVEALCRWKHAELGDVSPVDFIPIAEETGLIIPLSKALMREAFESACQLNRLSQSPVTVSVNVSAKQFYEEDFVDEVIALFEKTQCKPAWVKFEITESLLLESKPIVLQALTALDALGIKISLDDFGTGQSAMAYLQKFPIHQIKMDRSFVKEIHTHEESALLVKAIVALAVSLKKETVAEGVETLEHQALLKSFGCPLGQGYLYSPAIPLNQLISFVQERNMINSS